MDSAWYQERSLQRRSSVPLQKVRHLSRKIVIEDDPVKIDRYLAQSRATVTKEMQNTLAQQFLRLALNQKLGLPGKLSLTQNLSVLAPSESREKNARM